MPIGCESAACGPIFGMACVAFHDISKHNTIQISGHIAIAVFISSFKVYGAEMEPFFMAAFQSAMLAGCFAAGIGIVVAFLRCPENNNC